MQALGLAGKNFQLYSLRTGGATDLFRSCGSFDEVTDRGRWKNVRTARLYIDGALQDLAEFEPVSNDKLVDAERALADLLG